MIILNKVYIMFNNIPAKKKHIVNYGFGNLIQVANTIEFLGFESAIINNPEKLSLVKCFWDTR